MIHHYLFFIQNNEVKVFRYKKNEIVPCSRDGFSAFPFYGWDDLWIWWKIASGITSKDSVDFLFVSNICMECSHPFTVHKTSVWGKNLLESFFTSFCESSKIDILWESGSKIRIKDTPSAKLPEITEGTSFYISPALDEIQIKTENVSKDDTLYNHFHEEIEKNRKRNNS